MTRSLDPAHFDALYAGNPDPWAFETSPYEHDKYAITHAALAGRHFTRGLEIGCSIGVLTRMLAQNCEALLGVDVADAALEQARRRCAAYPGITFTRMQIPKQWPDGKFDLFVISEVLYYLDCSDNAALCANILKSASPGSVIVLVNWTGPNDGAIAGDEAVALFMHSVADRFEPIRQQRAERYRLDVLTSSSASDGH